MVAYGWQTVAQVWAAAIALMGIVFWFTTKDDPGRMSRRSARASKPKSAWLELRAAQERPGLALRALLFLRLRRLRGPCRSGCRAT